MDKYGMYFIFPIVANLLKCTYSSLLYVLNLILIQVARNTYEAVSFKHRLNKQQFIMIYMVTINNVEQLINLSSKHSACLGNLLFLHILQME
jgi:hypothetical protein